MVGLPCPKRLWWEVHEPDAPELEADPARQFRFDMGHEVGQRAQAYVPGGVLIDVPHGERDRRLRETDEALRAGARVLYEAAFEHDGVLVVADILERGRRGWNLIEVKSSTRVKDEHYDDVAVQTCVLRGAGLEVRRAEVMHLNRDCRHPDLSNLFMRGDITGEIEEMVDEVPARVRALKRVLRGPLPEVAVGDHCYEPYDCPFVGRCWADPPRHAIGTLYNLRARDRERLEQAGYATLLDLPEDAPLTPIQRRQREAARRNGLVVEPGLGAALEELEPPVAYLDFETILPPIPVWEGCAPYDKVPVQISVHRQDERGRLGHREWLADGPGDPRGAMAERLIEFTEGARTIVAYNAPFERGCIRMLREHLPRLAKRLRSVEERLRDLLPIVRDHVYHPDFGGSFGLKNVAPALVPGIAYEKFAIAGGEDASNALHTLLLRSDLLAAEEKRRLRRDLLRYCRTDTEALARLHEALRRIAGR
jgi:hypothetical protein